ncbi:NfeD-like C-terminal, partner-binding [Flavobacterium gillisiae]|uniref:NfeD-like C-terminal, partner-binding n=1 Tax=Flavobacterium gillisiae TaxID=150146 RepID=A0A1H4CR32_9FLAO|nr:NfeD family protein [Flavobacterium gillisiae]SEA62865.1 NfeD-like C-terminal, partner-binding [Flavobacterium gillisiae]
MNFLENYEPLLKAFWYIALPVSLFFGLQTIMTFIGLSDGETDMDSDTGDVDLPFEIFTLRNLINFLLGFSWTGISFYNSIENKTILIIVSVLVGLLFVAIFFFLIKQILKLSENNSFKLENTLGKTAQVYLTIPESKSGKGKVLISVNGAIHELDAMTLSTEKIPSSTAVKVVAIENNLLIVEKN